MPEEAEKSHNLFLYIMLGGCLLAIATSFYFFYLKKDYTFMGEVACDPTEETCSQRDCTNPDDCPPNGLSDFKRYSLNAGDFAKCENEDCEVACESGAIACEQLECEEDPDYGEYCVSPETEATPTEETAE